MVTIAFLLGIEFVRIIVTSWALHIGWQQWKLSDKRRLDSLSEKLSVSEAFSHRVRREREMNRMLIHITILIGSSVVFVWRVDNLIHGPIIPIGTLNIVLLIVALLVWAQTRKEIRNQMEMHIINETEDKLAAAAALVAVTMTSVNKDIQNGVKAANEKLDEMRKGDS